MSLRFSIWGSTWQSDKSPDAESDRFALAADSVSPISRVGGAGIHQKSTIPGLGAVSFVFPSL
jgi:hypothetical protein